MKEQTKRNDKTIILKKDIRMKAHKHIQTNLNPRRNQQIQTNTNADEQAGHSSPMTIKQ